MAIETQSDTEIGFAYDEELGALQAILAAQGKVVEYDEAAAIGRELVGFFEALGEPNEEDNHA